MRALLVLVAAMLLVQLTMAEQHGYGGVAPPPEESSGVGCSCDAATGACDCSGANSGGKAL